jgi:uncharacterized OsmC-like protein
MKIQTTVHNKIYTLSHVAVMTAGEVTCILTLTYTHTLTRTQQVTRGSDDWGGVQPSLSPFLSLSLSLSACVCMQCVFIVPTHRQTAHTHTLIHTRTHITSHTRAHTHTHTHTQQVRGNAMQFRA